MARIGHNRPPPDKLVTKISDQLVTNFGEQVEPFNLDHRPHLSAMDVDGICDVIRQLESELRPMRDTALLRHQMYRNASGWGGPTSYGVSYGVGDVRAHKLPEGFDHNRFRELQSILADCRIELRERRSPHHPEAKPSAHEQHFGLMMTGHASQSHSI